MTPPPHNPSGLLRMPSELLNECAAYLPSYDDIINFAATCHCVKNALYDPRAPCWRKRFATLYDLPPCKATTTLKAKLRARNLLRYRLTFKLGEGRHIRGRPCQDEKAVLGLMKDLVVESYSSGREESNNVKALLLIANCTNVCDVNNYWNRGSGKPTRLLQTIHTMLLVPQLERAFAQAKGRGSCTPGDLFPISQKVLYEHPDKAAGLFSDDEFMTVNLDLVGHISNFFKYHVACDEEGSLLETFEALEKHEKPSMWDSQLLQGPQKLTRHWKGCFASMYGGDVELLRSYHDPTNCSVYDDLALEHGLIELDLRFGVPGMIFGSWSREWDDELRSTPSVRLIKALERWPTDFIASQSDPRRFTNDVTDEYLDSSFNVGDMQESAWRQYVARHGPKPTDVNEWQRLEWKFKQAWADISFTTPPSTPLTSGPRNKKRPAPLKEARAGEDYLPLTGTSIEEGRQSRLRGNLHAVAPVAGIPGWQRITFMKWFVDGRGQDGHRCFEGVVLPGNKIILGRWWLLADDEERRNLGPFIFWNTD